MSGSYPVALPGPPRPELQDLKNSPADGSRAVKAARQFESLLLSNWLQSVEEGLKSLGGDSDEPGADTLGAIGMQAIADGIANRGGIGLARILLKHLPVSASSETPEHQAGGSGHGVGADFAGAGSATACAAAAKIPQAAARENVSANSLKFPAPAAD